MATTHYHYHFYFDIWFLNQRFCFIEGYEVFFSLNEIVKYMIASDSGDNAIVRCFGMSAECDKPKVGKIRFISSFERKMFGKKVQLYEVVAE